MVCGFQVLEELALTIETFVEKGLSRRTFVGKDIIRRKRSIFCPEALVGGKEQNSPGKIYVDQNLSARNTIRRERFTWPKFVKRTSSSRKVYLGESLSGREIFARKDPSRLKFVGKEMNLPGKVYTDKICREGTKFTPS